ncbi:MAG: MipA/OmpV family protein [Rhodospirillales bacterium]|nr:MipA/OmpV family protein [Rhodospirillales bacterium]
MLDGKTLQAGPTFDYRPNTPHPEVPQIAVNRDNLNNPVEVGGFVGYLFHDEASGLPPSSLGFNHRLPPIQGLDQLAGAARRQLLDRTGAVVATQHRLSTYSPDGSNVSALGVERSSSLRPSDPGFQDVGIGLGLGYSITDSWNIQTQARYQRMLGANEPESQSQSSPNQFFGGVMVDYKF